MVGILKRKKDKWYVRFNLNPHTTFQYPVYNQDIDFAEIKGINAEVNFFVMEKIKYPFLIEDKCCRLLRKK